MSATTLVQMSPLPAARSWVTRWGPTTVIAALVAAVGDAAFAFVAYVLVDHRYNFETLLQYIASGLAGHAAFASGWTGVGYAAAGFGIHLALALGFAGLYALTVARWVRTLSVATVVGLVYGAGIWLFMNAVVLPIGRSTREDFFNGYYTAFFIDHALLVGLPIALILFAAHGRSTMVSLPWLDSGARAKRAATGER